MYEKDYLFYSPNHLLHVCIVLNALLVTIGINVTYLPFLPLPLGHLLTFMSIFTHISDYLSFFNDHYPPIRTFSTYMSHSLTFLTVKMSISTCGCLHLWFCFRKDSLLSLGLSPPILTLNLDYVDLSLCFPEVELEKVLEVYLDFCL